MSRKPSDREIELEADLAECEGRRGYLEKLFSDRAHLVADVPQKTEREILEAAIDRMGWPEIHAFQDELRRGQDVFEDAGGFMMRAIRRLFGLPSPVDQVVTYQQAARAMIDAAEKRKA